MAPPSTRSQGGPSSQSQQQSPPAKETIEIQDPEAEEKQPKEQKGKKGKPTVDEKLDILATELHALRQENTRLARQLRTKERTSTFPLFGANQTREGTVPPPSYHGMPEVKGYKPTPPKPYDGTTDVEGFLVQARLHLKFYENSLTEDYQKVMAIFQLLAGKVLLWSEPIMNDYLVNYPDQSSDLTNYVFGNYEHFEERMRALFGDSDRE
ncbi:hypothetical protein DL768_010342 [Monosporascus sp. mg162]|nr:hypothetical protein DL768_010342 [Monosporascus sp. mg162]